MEIFSNISTNSKTCLPPNLIEKILYNSFKQGSNKILLFEVPSSTDWNISNQFNPNIFIEIDISTKLKMLKYYSSEMRGVPHPRSDENIKALSRFRGGQVGCEFAEAFFLYREILK